MLVQRILVRVNATFTAADSRRVKKRVEGRYFKKPFLLFEFCNHVHAILLK